MSDPGDALHPRSLLAILAAGLAAILLGRSARPAPIAPPDLHLRVDPNVTPAEVLGALPGLGPARVAALVAAREVAPLRSLDDVDRRVRGIGPATAAAIGPYLRFDSPLHPRR